MPRLMGSRSLGGDLWWGRGVDGEGEGEEGRVGHLRRDFRIMSRAPWLDTSEEGRRRNRGMAGGRSDRRGGGFESRTDSSPLLSSFPVSVWFRSVRFLLLDTPFLDSCARA